MKDRENLTIYILVIGCFVLLLIIWIILLFVKYYPLKN